MDEVAFGGNISKEKTNFFLLKMSVICIVFAPI
jgi:hypothetical protein